ncbi:hypothetical protein OD91_1032 [Lutibacter sp. Hel_I_33_5]|uniref:hypothetical protein n=1 Tax=Lutibacter sp. Hel_I_33_5 TaxID=1566289 RepID=UPI00119EE52D|nr:hypothetical protein [Lutibacter sp. Hel_I_33_5]TVZ55765.1 hypothetical protein OD91_1032 [Lutibacter sp. Hel_I_33_5]
MKKLYSLTTILILFISLQGFAQLDNSTTKKKKNTSLNLFSTPTKLEKPKSVTNTSSGFKSAYQKEQERLKTERKEFALKYKGIITPAVLRRISAQKNYEKNNLNIPMIDKDLGVFRTKTKYLYFAGIDYGIIDGDIISVYKNGVAVLENYKLNEFAKKYAIPIELGFNKVEIIAINQGELGANTGAFSVLDGKDRVVISDYWALAKGAKVIALVIREEE